MGGVGILLNDRYIFNISFPKTGTTSIEAALSILGYSVAHGTWRSVHTNYLYAQYVNNNIDELLYFVKSSKFNCFSDGPWFSPNLYSILEKEFPNAKFILSERNSELWFDSLRGMLLKTGYINSVDGIYKSEQYGLTLWFKKVFKTSQLDKKKLIEIYNKHNQDIISFFKNKPGKLIKFELKNIDWKCICQPLGVELPNIKFPKKNFR